MTTTAAERIAALPDNQGLVYRFARGRRAVAAQISDSGRGRYRVRAEWAVPESYGDDPDSHLGGLLPVGVASIGWSWYTDDLAAAAAAVDAACDALAAGLPAPRPAGAEQAGTVER